MDYNLTLGKGKDAQQISSNDLKGGVKKEGIKDEKMRSIFEALDDGNGILEEKEVNQLKAKVQEAASKDGDATNLSNKEAKSLIKSLGLKGFKVEDVFRFLSTVKAAGVNIDYQTRDVEKPDEIVIKYKPDAEGNSVIERHNCNDGSLVGSIIQDKNNNTMIKNADNRITGGKNDVGKYERTYNEDGGYTDTYEDGRILNFDRDGKRISGTNINGETYTVTYNYNEDGSYTETYSDGETREYDKNGKLLSGKLADGTTWKNEYHEDGSCTRTYSDGETREYDKNGKELSGKLADGTTWKNEYHEDGSYTETYSSGKTLEYDKNDKELSGKLADGRTWKTEYHEDGSYTRTYSDGVTQEYDKNDKELSGKFADGTTWKCEYHEDGSYTRTYSDGKTKEFDKNGKELSGKFADGTTWKCEYHEDGNLKYNEYTNKDGSKHFSGADGKTFAKKTANGNFRVSPKQGETFDDTMKRLGITDPADQEMFKKANPKAYKRGYFLLGKENQQVKGGDFLCWDDGDIYIPKELADKLNIEDMLVDKTAEMKKHKQALKTPQMGL